MHKKEASILFGVLANENAVKMAKMLYNIGPMNYDSLFNIIGASKEEFEANLDNLIKNELVNKNDDVYAINQELLETLLGFITTPCKCSKK